MYCWNHDAPEALNCISSPLCHRYAPVTPLLLHTVQEFQVYRWNPDAPEAPKYVSYKVDINACGPMMLDVLLKIKDEQDQTLALRRSCRCAWFRPGNSS